MAPTKTYAPTTMSAKAPLNWTTIAHIGAREGRRQQLRALLVIFFSGGASGDELAEGLGVGLATATGIVDRLGAQGLVRRAEDPDDRRIRRVYLTQEGDDLIQRLTEAGLKRKKEILDNPDLENLRRLAVVTEKLREAAEAHTEGHPAARRPARSG